MLDEALFGADFLLRMQHSIGYFYTTVFDKWSKNPQEREHVLLTQQGQKSMTTKAVMVAALLSLHWQQQQDSTRTGTIRLRNTKSGSYIAHILKSTTTII